MDTKIDQDVIDELISMLEDHIAGGLKKPDEKGAEEEIPGVEAKDPQASPDAGEADGIPEPDADDEDMKKLMELYSRG